MNCICSICLASNKPRDEQVCVTMCGHVYHYQCLESWVATGKSECPECRSNVTMASIVKKIHPNVDEESARKIESLKLQVQQLKNEAYYVKHENSLLKAANGGKSKFIT